MNALTRSGVASAAPETKMAVVVPSRFAKLKIVEDDFVAAKIKEMKLQTTKQQQPCKGAGESSDRKSKNGKTSKGQGHSQSHGHGQGQGQSQSHGQVQTQGKVPSESGWQQLKKKRRAPLASSTQWEEWKERDSQQLDGHFQEDMNQAILLSKIEFEAQNKLNKIIKEQNDIIQGCSKKQKKNKNMIQAQAQAQAQPRVQAHPPTQVQDHPPEPSEKIGGVECLETATRAATSLSICGPASRAEASGGEERVRAPPSDAEIKGSQLRSALAEQKEVARTLRLEVEALKEELIKVKTRNKKLCNIIGQGEMKDKAEVLVETENLREMQAELNAEVAALHATLQQERSRCSCGNRQDKKKRPPTAASGE